METKTQKQLVEQACLGDVGSFGKLYEHYYATMVWLAYSIVKDVTTAEDIAQQSFATACENLGSLKDKEKFANWLSGICRNTALTSFALSKKDNVSIDDVVLVCNDEGNDVEEQKIVQKSVFELPQMYREVVVLHYYNDMSYDQIKDLLGVSLHTVRGRLRRARKKIEKYLKKQNFENEV